MMFDPRGHLSTRPVASPLVAATLLLVSLGALTHVGAQDLTYTSVTKVEFGGPMGMMMQMVPDVESETSQTVYIKGTLMRTDEGDTSSIMDMAEGRYTLLDHPSRTYYTITLDQMQDQVDEARERMTQQSPMVDQGPPPEASFDIQISTDRTGRTRSFEGTSAEQILVTMELVPTSPEAMETTAMMGRTVLFTEMWISSDLPGADVYRQVQETMGEAFMEGGGAGMAMGQAMTGNPDLREALERNLEEMKNLEGVPVRTTTHMVSVPAGMAFDPDAVLEALDQPLEAGEMPSMAEAAREAARGALGRRMGGLLGRRNQERDEPQEPEAPATQIITMRSVSTIQDIRTQSLSTDLFQPPAGYEEKEPDWVRG